MIYHKCETQCYIITPKGEEFLEDYEEYSKGTENLKEHRKEINAKKRVLEQLCSKKKLIFTNQNMNLFEK